MPNESMSLAYTSHKVLLARRLRYVGVLYRSTLETRVAQTRATYLVYSSLHPEAKAAASIQFLTRASNLSALSMVGLRTFQFIRV